MIAEFAIEPRVMAKWRHFPTFFREFGVPSGRLVCRFPGDWAKQVVQLAHQFTHDMTNSPMAAKRIEERVFGEAFKRKLVPARRPYDPTKPWLQNATGFPPQDAFHAVIAETGCDDQPRVLNAEELLDDPLYCVDTGEKVGRTAEELVAYALPLLKVSEELVLVDPNFKTVDAKTGKPVYRFLDTLAEILEQRQKMKHPLKRLELHLERSEEVCSATGRREFEQRIARRIPAGMAMKVFLWQAPPVGERLHARFVLTELGGIKYDYGLDEGRQGERTIVMLLPDGLWQTLRQDYCESGQTFAIDRRKDIFILQGS